MFHPIKQFLLLLVFVLTACSTVYRSAVPKGIKETTQKGAMISGRRIEQSATDLLVDPTLERIANEKSGNAVLLALPLSGKNDSLGQEILAACLLAQQELGNCDVDIYVVDSSDINLDMHKVHDQLKCSNLRAIIGPVFYGEIKKFSALFPTVPLFTLSNDERSKGNHVFVCGLTPRDEIKRLFMFMKLMKIDSIFVALPRGEFGDTLLKCLKKELGEDYDMEVLRYSSISPKNARKCVKNSIKKAVFALDPVFNVPEKASNNSFERTSAITDDGKKSAGRDNDYRTHETDTKNCADRKIFTLSSCVLADKTAWNGAFFAFAKNNSLTDFSVKYKAIFAQDPSILGIIAYDLSRVILLKISENSASLLPAASAANTTISGNFSGCLGQFTIHGKRGIIRRLSILRHLSNKDIIMW
ncbi:MAG: hypothetical protein LBT90_04280 [Holosporaceae bacterium]|jgi:hypothetical protein|nr:hypothetical protein [Holosporaceae bacterium]